MEGMTLDWDSILEKIAIKDTVGTIDDIWLWTVD